MAHPDAERLQSDPQEWAEHTAELSEWDHVTGAG